MTEFERNLRDRLRAAPLPEAPSTLIRALDEIAQSPLPARRRRTRPVALLAVAAVLVGAGLLATGAVDLDRTDDGPSPTAPVAVLEPPTQEPTPAATPASSAEVEGLHVYTVAELQSERAAGNVSGGPLALAGYWTYLGLMHSCAPPESDPSDLEIYCHDGEYGITELNEPSAVLTQDGRLLPASGPMLTPWLPNEEWILPLVSLQPVNGQPFPPVPIVAVGHLDDERAAECRPEQRQLCLDRFVIDRLITFQPGTVPTPGITPTPSPFAFDSPPPLSLDLSMCENTAGTTEFSFVGWMAGEELAAQLASGITLDGVTVAVAITRDPVRVSARNDENGKHYRVMGRQVCFAREWEQGSAQFDTIKGSLYRLYDDGTVVPTHTPLRS